MIQHIDYVTTYFPYKTPPLVRSEPTYKDLKRIKTELRANASSVESTLGGGDHGHLFLVLTSAEYLQVPSITDPTFAPTWPGTLWIPPNSGIVQAIHIKEQHHERIRIYRECQNVDKALLNHLQRSLEPKYLESFVDDTTPLLTSDIPVKDLFLRYGTVHGIDVKNLETEVLKTAFAPSEPLVLIWNPIEKLKKLAIQAKLPYSEAQLIEFALHIIRNTHDFKKALGDWNAKSATNKTWVALKSHFSHAQEDLKAIRGPTMAQAGYHHINMIANDIWNEFTHTHTELVNLIAALDDKTEQSLGTTPPATATMLDMVSSRGFPNGPPRHDEELLATATKTTTQPENVETVAFHATQTCKTEHSNRKPRQS